MSNMLHSEVSVHGLEIYLLHKFSELISHFLKRFGINTPRLI